VQTILRELLLVAGLWLALSAGSLNAQFTGLADVNGSLPPGQFTTNGPGSYTMLGGGADIWDASEQFFYAYYPVTGHFDMRVRVQWLESADTCTKAGLMVRA